MVYIRELFSHYLKYMNNILFIEIQREILRHGNPATDATQVLFHHTMTTSDLLSLRLIFSTCGHIRLGSLEENAVTRRMNVTYEATLKSRIKLILLSYIRRKIDF